MPGLHRLPGDEPDRDTVLQPGDLITAVELPPPPPGRVHLPQGARARLVRVRARVAWRPRWTSRRRTRARTAGWRSAAWRTLPWRAVRRRARAAGAAADGEEFTRAADAELAEARPLPRNGYKVTLARNLIVRTLQELLP